MRSPKASKPPDEEVTASVFAGGLASWKRSLVAKPIDVGARNGNANPSAHAADSHAPASRGLP
jgi:hypothetical protein